MDFRNVDSAVVPCKPRATFDLNTGPKVGTTLLLKKTNSGFTIPPREDLEAAVAETFGCRIDGGRLSDGLAVIARALDAGDLALAAIATGQLRFVPSSRARPNDPSLRKAGVDDPRWPGWPAKTPGSLGGKFRPKNGIAVPEASRAVDRAARIARLRGRRSVRAVLRRVLTAKRVARLFLEGLGEAIPVLDAVDTVAMIEDIAEITGEIAEANAEVDAAVAFVEQGPLTIEELTVGAEEESFPSFDAFKKIDLVKRFGPAGDGYEYHHIVEQSAGLDGISPAQLNSTSNIVRIPKLLHEEINASYASRVGDSGRTLRETLKNMSFEERRAAGLDELRKIGVLSP